MKIKPLPKPMPLIECPCCYEEFTATFLLQGFLSSSPEEPVCIALCDECYEEFTRLPKDRQQSDFELYVDWGESQVIRLDEE